LLHGADPADPAASAIAPAGENGAGDWLGAGCTGRRPVVPVLSRPAAEPVSVMAGDRRAPAFGRNRCRLDEPLAGAATRRGGCVRGHVVVLAMGAAGPDPKSAAGARLLLARELSVQHLVRRPLCAGKRSPLGVPADLYPGCPPRARP